MESLIHNISILLISAGIIILTIYWTKAKMNGYKTEEQIIMEYEKLNSNGEHLPDINANVYYNRPSQTYKKMFNDASIWMNYHEFDPEEKTDKIYVKTN